MSHVTQVFVDNLPSTDGTHVHDSCHTCKRVMSHRCWWMIRPRFVTYFSICKVFLGTHVHDSCHTYDPWFIKYLMDEWWHKYAWVMLHMWMSHDTQVFVDDLPSNHVKYRVSHVIYKYERVISYRNDSNYMWLSHVKYKVSHVTYKCERVMSHMGDSNHIWASHITYESVTYRIRHI